MSDVNKDEEDVGKSEELEVLTGVPTVITCDGTEYGLFPLDLEGMAALRKWAKEMIVTETRENLRLMGEELSEEMKASIWKAAYSQLSDPLVSSMIECPEAISFWAFLSLKKGDKSITRERASEILCKSDLKTVLEILKEINGMTKESALNPQVQKQLEERRKQIGQPSL